MRALDPYHPTPPFEYECAVCSGRIRSEHHPGVCSHCGGVMRDVSVPRE